MSDHELKIGSSIKIADQPLVELDGPVIFVSEFSITGPGAMEDQRIFCEEVGSQIEVLKGMQSPFMKQLYWQLLAMESRVCEPKVENESFSLWVNPGEKIMSQREACERARQMPDIDPGFYKEAPPWPEGAVRPVPMPIYETPGPNLDPCFDPCSEECLDRVEPRYFPARESSGFIFY